ncbi:MAG: chemotaxis protein CheW [Chitinophagales bacterium]
MEVVPVVSGIEQEVQLVVFSLGEEEYGVPVGQVQEIIRMAAITQMPKAPSFVEGVINLRGRVIPVVDLKRLFDLGQSAHDDKSRIIVVEVGDKTVGITVDDVSEVLRLPVGTIDPPPAVAGADQGFLTGVGKLDQRLLMLLDLEKLMPGLSLAEAGLTA